MDYNYKSNRKNKLLRQNPVVAGVAGGIAEALDLPAWLIRLLLFISVFTTVGFTLLLYLAAAFSFSSKKHFENFGEAPKIFGGCYYASRRMGLDVGWVRFAVLTTSILTGFFPVPFLYVVFHLFSKSPTYNNI
jgi:phage shock protein PspC (stress-responsive transcriptional regulator)